MNRTKYSLLILQCFLVLNVWSQKTIHGAIFANTYDKTIGESSSKNFDSIKKWMLFMAKASGFELDLKEFKDKAFSYTSLDLYIKNLDINDSDVVIFYLNSHGYRSDNVSDIFPRIVIPTGTSNVTGLYSTSKINESLSTKFKNASSVITIIQACNKTKNRESDLPNIPNLIINKSEENIRALLNSKMNVFVTSSQPGKTSYADSGSGSRFTRAFLFSFYSEVVSQEPSNINWEIILKRAVKVNYSLHGRFQRDRYPVWEIKKL